MKALVLALLLAVPAAAGEYVTSIPCSEDPPEAAWTFARLKRLAHCRGLRTVEELLELLPRDYFERYVLIYGSKGLHGSSFEKPRLVLYGENRRLVVGVAGDAALAHGNGFETVEYKDDGSYELGEIVFPPAGSTEPVRSSVVSPASCLECHPRPPAPVWSSYPLWPGAYGSGARGAEAEAEGFRRFLAESLGRGRYKRLKGVRRERDLGRLRKANAELSWLFETQAAERVLADIARHQRWPEAKRALMAAYKGCDGFEAAVPSAVPFAVHRASAEARVQALFAEQAREAARLAGGSAAYDGEPWLYLPRVEKLIRLGWAAKALLGLDLDDYSVARERTLLLSHHAAHETKLERLDFHLGEASCAELLAGGGQQPR